MFDGRVFYKHQESVQAYIMVLRLDLTYSSVC